MVAELWLSGPAKVADSYRLQPFSFCAPIMGETGQRLISLLRGRVVLVLQEDFNRAEAKGVICEREGRSEVV